VKGKYQRNSGEEGVDEQGKEKVSVESHPEAVRKRGGEEPLSGRKILNADTTLGQTKKRDKGCSRGIYSSSRPYL